MGQRSIKGHLGLWSSGRRLSVIFYLGIRPPSCKIAVQEGLVRRGLFHVRRGGLLHKRSF